MSVNSEKIACSTVSSEGVVAYGVGQGAAAASDPTIILDTFTDTGSTAITSHTPDSVVSPASGGWSGTTSGVQIDAGGTNIESTTGAAYPYIDSGISDGIFVAKGVPTTSSLPGLMFRGVDDTNHWWFRHFAGTNHRLYEIVAGSYITRITSMAGTAGADDQAALANGNDVTCYVNGVEAATYSGTPSVNGTRVGIAMLGVTVGSSEIIVKNSTDASEVPA